jgi:hypothetical protein
MKSGIKLIIALLDIGMILLLIVALDVTFSPSGLHYLAIVFSAIGVLFLNLIRLLIVIRNGRKSIINYFPFITVILIFIGAILSPEYNLLARIFTGFSCFLMAFVAFDFWHPQNLIHSTIDKIIKYFSVDFEAKGWAPKNEDKK